MEGVGQWVTTRMDNWVSVQTKKAKYPTLIRGDIENQRIECIGTGGWFSAFLSVTGQVFTCGNIARQFWDNDRQIMVSNHNGEKKQTQYIPRAVIMKDIHDGVNRICKIGCGNRFLLMQDLATMNVYDLGNPNPHLGREQDDPYPSLTHYIHPVTLNRNLIDFQCKKIDGGDIFSVLLDYKGNLFTASLQEDYVCVQSLRTRNVPVIDVCCSWAEYIALDASGLVHIGNVVHKELVTLLSLGPMKQIGAGNIQMYARSGKTVLKISEDTASDQTTPEQLQFEEEVDLNEKEFIQLTGCYFTTMIHLANVKCLPLMPNIHSLRMRQVLCDVTIICATNNNDYEM